MAPFIVYAEFPVWLMLLVSLYVLVPKRLKEYNRGD